jgi:hypothetical protein
MPPPERGCFGLVPLQQRRAAAAVQRKHRPSQLRREQVFQMFCAHSPMRPLSSLVGPLRCCCARVGAFPSRSLNMQGCLAGFYQPVRNSDPEGQRAAKPCPDGLWCPAGFKCTIPCVFGRWAVCKRARRASAHGTRATFLSSGFPWLPVYPFGLHRWPHVAFLLVAARPASACKAKR